MRQKLFIQSVIYISLLLMLVPNITFAQKYNEFCLKQEFDLAGKRSQQTQFYIMKSECINFAQDGKRTGKDGYKLFLKWIPAATAGNARDEFTCLKFIVQFGDASEQTIPALENWSYSYDEGIDVKNQVFGIDHDKFENLKDSNENLVPTEPFVTYLLNRLQKGMVYSNFKRSVKPLFIQLRFLSHRLTWAKIFQKDHSLKMVKSHSNLKGLASQMAENVRLSVLIPEKARSK